MADPWLDPAFIEEVASAGFPGSSEHTDEAFLYALYNFRAGGAPLAQSEEGSASPQG